MDSMLLDSPETDVPKKKKKDDHDKPASWARKAGKTTFTVPLDQDVRELVRIAAARNGESSAAYAARILEQSARRDAT